MIFCISPLPNDISHSINTLRYASAMIIAQGPIVLKADDNDPSTWSAEKISEWITKVSLSIPNSFPIHFLIVCCVVLYCVVQSTNGDLDPRVLLRSESDCGLTVAQLPEQEFITRVLQAGSLSEVRAHLLYQKFVCLFYFAWLFVKENGCCFDFLEYSFVLILDSQVVACGE